MRTRLPRRLFLKGSLAGGLVTLALPTFEASLNTHGTAWAAGEPLPKRFGVWFFGNGVKPGKWFPKATGPAWELSPELAGMADVKAKITIVSGTNCPAGGQVHHSGMGGMLTGDTINLGANDASNFRRPSIDHLIAQKWKGRTKFDNVNVSIWKSFGIAKGAPGQISHNGTGFNPNELDAGALYDRMFGAALPQPAADAGNLAKARAQARAKVLDAVMADQKDLRGRLGANDQKRLDQHLEGLLSLQRRVRELEDAPAGAACAKPKSMTAPASSDSSLGARNTVMSEIVARALACDLTRVFTIQHHTWYSPVFREAGNTGQQHGLTHDEAGDQPQVHASNIWVMKQLATFIKTLRDIGEGAGTLLDNCLVFATSDVSEGRSHSKDNMPILIAGGAGGAFRAGTHFNGGGASSYRVHVTLFKALGVDIPSFGAAGAEQKQPFSELLL